MTTGLERITAKARQERKLQFTSLAHHITSELVWDSLCDIPNGSAPGCDGQTVSEAKESFQQWVPEMLRAIHDRGYQPPPIRRVYIPKPGKTEKRPLGIPCVADRALQRSVARVVAAIYEQDFLACSFGGRPGLSAHHALATLSEVIAGTSVSYVLEADLKKFLRQFGPRLAPALSRMSSRRSAYRQPYPSVVEGWHLGRGKVDAERSRCPARRIGQRVAK